tara:strand:- start:13 stop:408 length:396 start_codon:yes stop_codon:yes gene_type:complete
MKTESNFLFTYGTLMQRFDNEYARLLRLSANFIETGSLPGRMYRIDWYPGVIYEENSPKRVFGEIYKLNSDRDLLRKLDEYEDIQDDISSSLYQRKVIPITLESGKSLDCWVYLYNQSIFGLKEILSGRFY